MTQLQCPLCGSPSTFVVDTRQTKSGTRRRYECPRCEERFTTSETVVKDRLVEEIERKMAQVVSLREQIEELEGDIETLKIRQQAERERKPPKPKPQHKVSEQVRRQQLKASIARVKEKMRGFATNEPQP